MSGEAILRHAKPSADFSAKLERTTALLCEASEAHTRHGPAQTAVTTVTQASSLGAEDMVITHLIDKLALPIDVFVLDTGMLHLQTLALLQRLQSDSRLTVRVFTPDAEAAAQFVARAGSDAMYRSIDLRKACCTIRKTEPLERALAGYDGWITGMRREQSAERAAVAPIDQSQARTKYNPLAEWTQGDVWHYIGEHGVAYNPLHDEFFPSIGCAPCTRAVSLGEDLRAGRWWWEDDAQKECGLHVRRPNPSNLSYEGTPA